MRTNFHFQCNKNIDNELFISVCVRYNKFKKKLTASSGADSPSSIWWIFCRIAASRELSPAGRDIEFLRSVRVPDGISISGPGCSVPSVIDGDALLKYKFW